MRGVSVLAGLTALYLGLVVMRVAGMNGAGCFR